MATVVAVVMAAIGVLSIAFAQSEIAANGDNANGPGMGGPGGRGVGPMGSLMMPPGGTQSRHYAVQQRIARALIEAHGGTLTLTSAEGKGTTVTVTLPK